MPVVLPLITTAAVAVLLGRYFWAVAALALVAGAVCSLLCSAITRRPR